MGLKLRAAVLKVSISPTLETNDREAFVFSINGLAIHLDLGNQRAGEVEVDSKAGKLATVAGLGVVVHLNDIAEHATNLADDTFMVVVGGEAGKAYPTDDSLNGKTLRIEVRRPRLDGKIVTKNYPGPLG